MEVKIFSFSTFKTIKAGTFTDILIIGAALFLGMWQLVLFQNMMKWDIINLNLPWRYFISECIKYQTLPLWNPFITNGFPQTGDPMTWYPVSWIISMLFGSDLATIQYEYVLHLFVAGVGAYYFGKVMHLNRLACLFLGITFMFSGLFISNAQHLGWVVSGAWFPFSIAALLEYCRKQKMVNGLAFVLTNYFILSGGYPGFFIISNYIFLVVVLFALVDKFKRRDPRLSGFILGISGLIVAFVLLSAVVLVSSFELSGYLTRVDKFSIAYVNRFPLPIQGLLTFLFPFASTGHTNFFGSDFSLVNCYIGVIALIFLIFRLLKGNLQTWMVFLTGLFFLLTAISAVFPFRTWLYYLPFFNIFRFPALFRFFGYSFFIFLAAEGLHHFIGHQEKRPFLIAWFPVFILIAGFFLATAIRIQHWDLRLLFSTAHDTEFKDLVFRERIAFQALIQLVILSLLLAGISRLNGNATGKFIVLLVAVDIIISVQLNMKHTVIYDQDPRLAQRELKNLPKGFPKPDLRDTLSRVNEYSNPAVSNLSVNMNIFYKRPTPGGYTPYSLKSTAFYEKDKNYRAILKNPLLFLAGTSGRNNTIDTNSIDPLSYKKLEIVRFNPNSMVVRVQTEKKQLLTYLQNYYPGWHAVVNQQEQDIRITNGCFMSVWVGPGVSTVTFEYNPAYIKWSFYISLTTFVLITMAIIILLFRDKTA